MREKGWRWRRRWVGQGARGLLGIDTVFFGLGAGYYAGFFTFSG